MKERVLFRCLAGLLTAAGASVLSMLDERSLRDPMTLLFVIANCVLIFGFVMRVVRVPSCEHRRLLWGASVIVYGIQLAFCGILLLCFALIPAQNRGTLEVGLYAVLFLGWQILALAFSILGLRYDKEASA
jgi:hypothetical protein